MQIKYYLNTEERLNFYNYVTKKNMINSNVTEEDVKNGCVEALFICNDPFVYFRFEDLFLKIDKDKIHFILKNIKVII